MVVPNFVLKERKNGNELRLTEKIKKIRNG